jgi:choline dehydrogenase
MASISYLETQHDVDVLVRGMRLMFRLAKTNPLAVQIDRNEDNPEFDHKLEELTDRQLEDVVRQRSETLYVTSQSTMHQAI